ncbi:RES family NAD+ phosphorylase [Paenibacillus sp. FSL R7-0210]|uniref:RES family NAD+ phosphorylase n=1 Tax=Paenibacillus sp. FSL R7-0210 TaxID=2921676 RepID=UPI0030F7A504
MSNRNNNDSPQQQSQAKKTGTKGSELTTAEKVSRGATSVKWRELTSVEKALRDRRDVKWSELTPAEKALRDIRDVNWNELTPAEKALRDATNVKWSGLTSVEKALRDSRGVNWHELTPAEKALRDATNVKWSELTSVEKALRDSRGVNWNELTPAEKAIRDAANVIWGGLTPIEIAMRGIENVKWNDLTPSEKALRYPSDVKAMNKIADAGSTIQKAHVIFTERLDNLPKHYKYVNSEMQPLKEQRMTIISGKNNEPAVSVEELQNAFGLLDILKTVSVEEMTNFVSHLIRYPMLALEHKTGRLIRDIVKELAKKCQVTGSLFRCRPREVNDMMPWTESEMWEAPYGYSSQGRFNTAGNGVLYLSRSQDTAILEMKQPKGAIIDVMKLNFDAEIKLIDITKFDIPLFQYCMYKASNNTKIKKEYLVSNFFGQCCQREKIHAIKYKSVFSHNISNYVFFDYMREWFNYESSATIIT